MTALITHQPRVAWDGALALIRAARADDATASWCRDWVAELLGPDGATAFLATRRRVLDPTAAANEVQVQEGLWRVRLEDALRVRSDLAEALLERVADTRIRLA